MKNLVNFIFVLAIFNGFVSCSSSSANYNLEFSGRQVTMPLSYQMKPDFSSLQYVELGTGRYFTFYNKPTHTVYFFDIETETYTDSTVYATSGRHAISSAIIGYQVLAADTIAVATANCDFYLTDFDGHILKSFHFMEMDNDGTIADFIACPTFISLNPAIKDNNWLRLSIRPFKTSRYPTIDLYPLAVEIDMQKDSSLRPLPLSMPKELLPENGGSGSYAFTTTYQPNEGKVVYSYMQSHWIHTTTNDSTFTAVEVQSAYSNSEFEPKSGNWQVDLEKKVVETGRYYWILYDKTHDLYYRMYIPAQESAKENLMEANNYPRQFSLIILNKNLELAGETLLPENTYNFMHIYPTPEGLYLGRSHIYNPDFSEDAIVFDLYEPRKN